MNDGSEIRMPTVTNSNVESKAPPLSASETDITYVKITGIIRQTMNEKNCDSKESEGNVSSVTFEDVVGDRLHVTSGLQVVDIVAANNDETIILQFSASKGVSIGNAIIAASGGDPARELLERKAAAFDWMVKARAHSLRIGVDGWGCRWLDCFENHQYSTSGAPLEIVEKAMKEDAAMRAGKDGGT